MESSSELQTPKPPGPDLFNKLVFLQADLIYNALSFLFSPISTSLSLLSESFHRAKDTKQSVESAVRQVPSNVADGLTLFLKKLSYGLIGAALMCLLMVVLLISACIVGVGFMKIWIDEPLVLKERLLFDYTMAHPTAVFGFDFGDHEIKMKMKNRGTNFGNIIPVGHTFSVSVALLLPESDFNREVGVFQLITEVVSTNGKLIRSSSQPCMLRFRSTAIRLTRTFLTCVPLLLGISSESQKLTIEILKHKEVNRDRTGFIRISVIPRHGTSSLPELYEAQIMINSELPWTKELLRRWKWTCYIWVSLNLYVLFLTTALMLFWRKEPLLFKWASYSEQRAAEEINGGVGGGAGGRERSISTRDEMGEITVELLRKWQEIRRKKAALFSLGGTSYEQGVSSASSFSYGRGSVGGGGGGGGGFDEDVGDSDESMCLEGYEGEVEYC